MSKKTFLLDTLDTEDKFEVHTKICNVLYDKIIKINEKQESVNIGLFGEWGSGKSFIIKNLKQKLERNKICVYEFDAWKFNGKALERSILFELEKQAFTEKKPYLYKNQYRLSQRLYSKIKMESQLNVDYSNIKEKFGLLSKSIFLPFLAILIIKFSVYIPVDFIKIFWKNILDFLNENNLNLINVACESVLYIFTSLAVTTFIAKLLSKDIKSFLQVLLLRREDVKEEIQQTFSSEEFEDIFKDMIKQIKEKSNNQVLLVFDNIDRCEPKYAYEIITTIKTYMSINECIYIIPCDDEALKNYLEHNNSKIKNRNYAQEFLDKFFNVNIRIPSPSNQNLDCYINDCLNEIEIDILDQDKNVIRQILYYAYKYQNPRKIKRFINDFSMHYSLALEIDEKKQFLLNDIEIFTIIISIKQCWPQLEKALVEDTCFRERFYSEENFQKKIEDELGKDVVEFLLRIKTLFYNNKAIYSYIYYAKSDNELDIINLIRDGKPLEMTQYNLKILEQEYRFYNHKKEYIYYSALIESIFYSLKNKVGDKSREFEVLLNESILDINYIEDYSVYRFIENFTKEDFSYLDSINFYTKSLNRLIYGIYEYVRNKKFNADKIILKLLSSKILKYSSTFNLYLEIMKRHNECTFILYIEDILQNNENEENILDYFSEESYHRIFKSTIEEIKIPISGGCINIVNNRLEFILNEIKKGNALIDKYISYIFDKNTIYSMADEIKTKNAIYNLGVLIFHKSKESDIDSYKEFIDAFLANYKNLDSYKLKYMDSFCIYYYLYCISENDTLGKQNYEKYFCPELDVSKFVRESINLIGENYFIEKLYLNGNIGNLHSKDFVEIIENISLECLVKNYKNLVKLPILKIEIESLIKKLFNYERAYQLLSSKLYESLCKINEQDEINELGMNELENSYKLLKDMELLDYEVFYDKNILVSLYKSYPDNIKEILVDFIKYKKSNETCIEDILDFIYETLQVGQSISTYKSICDIINNSGVLTKNSIQTLENILNYILRLGRSEEEYDIAYEMLNIYNQDLSINKYTLCIKDLVENNDERFSKFIKNNLYENIR